MQTGKGARRKLEKAGFVCVTTSKHIWVVEGGERILQLSMGKLTSASEKMVAKLLSGRGLSKNETRAQKALSK